MSSHIFRKNYFAVVHGIFNEKQGIINAPIGRKDGSIIERCIRNDGDVAITEYSVIKEFNNMSLLHISLQTGRTHQIRVHMAYTGHSIVGDSLYGEASNLIGRQALHACRVSFIHPVTKEHMDIKADLPEDILNII